MTQNVTQKGFLGGLLYSKRFWVFVAALASLLLSAHVPALAGRAADIQTVIVTLALALIGGYTAQDVATALKTAPTTTEAALRDLLLEVLDSAAKSEPAK